MNKDVEKHIEDGYLWAKVPERVRMACGNSEKEYNRALIEHAIKNQVRYKGSIVRHVIKNEKSYYEYLLEYSKKNLMLYPYHLQERMIGLRMTSFSYYLSMMEDIMKEERSYDSLPNFTAADCLQLLGIGRNQYIELMNNSRSSRKFSFRRKPQYREFLPKTPIPANFEPWWIVRVGYITEDDIKSCGAKMKACIDKLIDNGPTMACLIEKEMLDKLYMKGLVFLDVPVEDETKVVVPPLEGFVMNRVLGDYFETLLYKIFVSIDEKTTLAELATVLDISLDLVKNAVSVFCRLGFARLKDGFDANSEPKAHTSWKNNKSRNASSTSGNILQFGPSLLDIDFSDDSQFNLHFEDVDASSPGADVSPLVGNSRVDAADDTSSMASHGSANSLPQSCSSGKRVAFLFDSSLTAFLMMGNLSPGLKNHAVTLFEVGKITDEGVGNFVAELYKVIPVEHDEGEARRYFEHAVNLRSTIEFLRHNQQLTSIFCGSTESTENALEIAGIGLDLIRCESLSGLDRKTVTRLINKNYHIVISMAPLNDEIVTNLNQAPTDEPASEVSTMSDKEGRSVGAYWFGPPSAVINSVWFKLYLYHTTGYGPPSLLLARGEKLCNLPSIFEDYEELLITSIGHEPCIISTSNAVLMLYEALTHSPVLIQGYGLKGTKTERIFLPFPFADTKIAIGEAHTHKTGTNTEFPPQSIEGGDAQSEVASSSHIEKVWPESDIVEKLAKALDLDSTCGYVTFLKYKSCKKCGTVDVKSQESGDTPTTTSVESDDIRWELLDVNFGIPLFEKHLNREVCEKFVSQKLCDRENVSKLTDANAKLSEDVQKFLLHYQSTDGFCMLPVEAENVPYPRQSLMFDKRTLFTWGGL